MHSCCTWLAQATYTCAGFRFVFVFVFVFFPCLFRSLATYEKPRHQIPTQSRRGSRWLTSSPSPLSAEKRRLRSKSKCWQSLSDPSFADSYCKANQKPKERYFGEACGVNTAGEINFVASLRVWGTQNACHGGLWCPL